MEIVVTFGNYCECTRIGLTGNIEYQMLSLDQFTKADNIRWCHGGTGCLMDLEPNSIWVHGAYLSHTQIEGEPILGLYLSIMVDMDPFSALHLCKLEFIFILVQALN